jgi:nucleoside-diphosphate-sugar epimerase
MQHDVVILGYGPVGRAAADLLKARGDRVLVAQRSRPADLAPGLEFESCDVLDAASVARVVALGRQLVVAIGFQYDGRTWLRDWPIAMRNILSGCEANGTRMVFFDNLYMYGPQTRPLVETMHLSDYGDKPRARAIVTRIWQDAVAEGRVRVAALRAPDFYGPGVRLSHLGDAGFGALAKGGAVTLIATPDTPHDFAYVPDLGANIVTLLDAPDDCYGEVWHSPCAPTLTPRQILDLGAKSIGLKARVRAVPLWTLPLLGVFAPFMRAIVEMRFQWDRPYQVDASKWNARFGGRPTPFADSAAATMRSFRKA